MTDGHEVSKRRSLVHENYAHRILTEIEAGPVSQRSLASDLGIALGLTNLLVRRLIRKGWIRVSRVRANRFAYFLTPGGMVEKARLSRNYFQRSVTFYAEARNRISSRFCELSQRWPLSSETSTESVAFKPVVFLGTGDLSEIGFVCLQETDLHLVGVVDFQGRQRFFGTLTFSAESCEMAMLDRLASAPPVIVAFSDSEDIRDYIRRIGVPSERVFSI